MYHLKAKVAFRAFRINSSCRDYEKFDPRKLARTLVQDLSLSKSNHWYKLKQFDYSGKSLYDSVPRSARMNMSEFTFLDMTFGPLDFEYYDEDNIDLLYKEYCEAFLCTDQHHKKTLRILKKMKKDKPELFI
ncbi:hypothetical protein [Vibrio phage phiKT1024]|nr:hypothetical protein [Vibrio phage phiKT1024]